MEFCSDGLVAETTATQTDEVDAAIAGWLLAGNDIRRNILIDTAEKPKTPGYSALRSFAIAMHQRSGTQVDGDEMVRRFPEARDSAMSEDVASHVLRTYKFRAILHTMTFDELRGVTVPSVVQLKNGQYVALGVHTDELVFFLDTERDHPVAMPAAKFREVWTGRIYTLEPRLTWAAIRRKYNLDWFYDVILHYKRPLTFGALGVFILWLGWFGFNPGSQLAADGADNAVAISHVICTTNMAAAVGGLSVLFLTWIVYGKPSLSLVCNGVLAGLVGITAGCDMVSIGGSAMIGLLCGCAMVGAVALIDKVFKIDDPVGAVSVHGVCGILGTILTGVFATDGGLLYGGGFRFLGIETLGALVTAAWAFVLGFACLKILDKIWGIRVEPRVEEEGLDVYEHGESAYNN